MNEPLVSVVMSVFNGEAYLREAVESILSQTLSDFEFIIINDGSTDGAASILESYAQSDRRVRVYHQENRGLIASLNRGCALAQRKYIARMDGDDISLGDRLMRQMEFLEKHAEVGLLGGAMEYIDSTGKTLATRHYPIQDRDVRSRLLLDTPFAHNTVVMRKEAFLSSGGYRAAFEGAEDYDLWVRMARHCQLANLGEVVLKYRIHPGSITFRKVRGQTMSFLAAHALASLCGKGGQDPLDSVREITPAVLTGLGVSEATVQRALAANYRNAVESMCRVGQEQAALRLLREMLCSSRWEHIEKRSRLIADTWLRAAGLYWRQDRYVQSLGAVGHALWTRPIVAGRPLKRILDRLTERWGRAKRLNAAGTD